MKTGQLPFKLDVLRPGDWIEMEFGFARRVFYIARNNPLKGHIWLGMPGWCVSSAYCMPYSEIRQDDLSELRRYGLAWQYENHPVYLGRTQKRWWWKFLPWRDIVCPYKPIRKIKEAV